jgi:ubiquinone/menaquinone biosynthesis C-methylase UbiE
MQKGTGGFLDPETILKQLDIRNNIQVADFGCGHGYFSIPLAKIVNQGKVYALDVIEEALQAVQSQAQLEGISNIETIRCNLEILGSSKLADESIDLVLLANILFQSQKKSAILKEAKRVLKKGGELVLIEWIAGASLAPKEGWLITKEEAQRLVEAEGMTLDRELEMDNQHYGLVFRKP